MLNLQIFKYLLAGGIAAIANYASRFLFSLYYSYPLAIVFAYVVGMLVAFALMRTHVFYAKGKPLKPQAYKFIGVNLFAILQTLVISLFLARWILPGMGMTENAEALAHFVGVLVPVVTSYYGHKYLTFR